MVEILGVVVCRNPYEDAKVLKAKLAEFTDWSEEQKIAWLSRMAVTLIIDSFGGSGTWKGTGWYVYNLMAQLGDHGMKIDLKGIEGLDPSCRECNKPLQDHDKNYRIGGTCNKCQEAIDKEYERLMKNAK